MEITGTQVIPAPRQVVWAALSDPVVLKNCLPGCESVALSNPNEFQVLMVTAIGPLRARFKGQLRMTEAQAPESCTMVFEGQGGAVGFAKGSSLVTLRDCEEGTELSYNAKAQIGGKLAQVGSRLIDSVAKKMSDDFFKALHQQLSPAPVAAVDSGEKPVASTSLAVALASPPLKPPVVLEDKKDQGMAESSSPTEAEIMVPGWWLAIAAMLGSAITIATIILVR